VKEKSHIPRRPRRRRLRLHRSNRLLQLQGARDRAGVSSGFAISPSPEASLSHRHPFFRCYTRVLRFAEEEGEGKIVPRTIPHPRGSTRGLCLLNTALPHFDLNDHRLVY